MKPKVTGGLLFGLALVLTLTISARPDGRDLDDEHNAKAPLEAVGVIGIPGNPLLSTDIAWVDPGTERLYFADRSNAGVDIIDAENDVFVNRVLGFAGANGPHDTGPGGVLVTPGRKLWAGDGNATVQVADVDPASPDYLKIIKHVDVSTDACRPNCNRADELGFDPKHHKILAAIDRPNSASDATVPIAPYAALIDADTYGVKFVTIPNIVPGGGLEQPLWDGELGRFFLTVPSVSTNGGNGEIAVINPTTGVVENTYSPGACAPSGEVLAPFQCLVVECSTDTTNSIVFLNALTGKIISMIPNVPADELWFNPGDDLVYAANNTTNVLNVIDPETRALIQSVPDVGGRNQAAFAENNHVFTPVRTSAAFVKTPSSDNTQCSKFGFKGTGCVAVFTHAEAEGRER
ncbi:MAG: hypothetical protein DMG32_21740 [Acidobacteria bacterium]|nr:MAG: hypothetical protein DMG32_21740 [Acidobacteriota bacterium]